MKYVCLIYLEEAKFAVMSQRERDGFINESLDSDDELRRSGHYVDANALEPPEAAVSVRVRNGNLQATDGPFAETKEHLGGFVIIEARDLNEAIQVAGRTPLARVGTVEVRPIRELERIELAGS